MTSKPDVVFVRGLDDQKVTAWAAFSYQGVIGPFFFMDDDEDTVTVTSEWYIKIISKFWRRLGMLVPNRDNQCFQQDGAAPHVAKNSLNWLREHFGERLISRSTDHSLSACRPNITLLDFHL